MSNSLHPYEQGQVAAMFVVRQKIASKGYSFSTLRLFTRALEDAHSKAKQDPTLADYYRGMTDIYEHYVKETEDRLRWTG
jgi:hypothetical protein